MIFVSCRKKKKSEKNDYLIPAQLLYSHLNDMQKKYPLFFLWMIMIKIILILMIIRDYENNENDGSDNSNNDVLRKI